MEPLIEVRAPEADDSRAIAEVQLRSWQVGYRGIFPDTYLDGLSDEIEARKVRWDELIERYVPLDRLLVAAIDGEVAAFSNFGPRGVFGHPSGVPSGPSRQEGEVYAFYTHPTHWRRGAGRLLMEATVERLSGERYPSAVLWVLRDNPRGRGFYEATGWEPTGDESLFARDDIAAPEVCYRRVL